MARSSGVAGTAVPGESFDKAGVTSPGGTARYGITANAGHLSFEFEDTAVRGTRTLDYFIGAGMVGRSYLTSIDGFLFQAPVSYYSGPAQWGVSPGYERDEAMNLAREVEPGCLNCHASSIQALPGTTNGYGTPPFREPGITCERCHGPGEQHVERMRSGKQGGPKGIVNPAKLDPARRENVCAQCHLPGAVEIAKAKRPRAFVPGDLLSDSVSILVWAGASREATVNGHFEQLARSACFRSAPGKLWCGTCHDAHTRVSEEHKPAYYRGRCLTCHTLQTCLAPHEARAKTGDDCTACHMPRTAAVTVQHAAYSDHTIPRTPSRQAPADIAQDAVLAPFRGFTASDRDLGLAYATVALQSSNRTWGLRAFELLRKVNAAAPRDSKVASKLAELYDRMSKHEEACSLYAGIVAAGEKTTAPAVNWGACLADHGDLEASMRLWQGVIDRNPAMESARLNLAVAQARTGRKAEARANLQEALRFNPASGKARALLNGLEP